MSLFSTLDWANSPESPGVLVLEGSCGMGKTIVCQSLYHRLKNQRRGDGGLPLPILFDLRNATRPNRPIPSAARIIEESLSRNWPGGGGPGIDYHIHDFAAALRSTSTLLIFDGLSEFLNSISPEDGLQVSRSLIDFISGLPAGGNRAVKMLFSVRPESFSSREDLESFISAAADPGNAQECRFLRLAELDEAYITAYLKNSGFSEETIESLQAFPQIFRLCRRPNVLKNIGAAVFQIQRDHLNNQSRFGLNALTCIVKTWFSHLCSPEAFTLNEKLLIATHLAFHFSEAGHQSMSSDALDSWFCQWILMQPELLKRHRDDSLLILFRNLKSSTFLIRQDQADGNHFSFVNETLYQFFLSKYLHEVKPWIDRFGLYDTVDFLIPQAGWAAASEMPLL